MQLVRNAIDDRIYSIKLQIRCNLQGSLAVRVWIQLAGESPTATARVGTVYSYVSQMQQPSVNTCWELHYEVERV